ncbi:hypothetical protein CAEBREN_06431 [Caenorhabditis brenneri]|uniref:Uncharacterized protein n=1 Tax=Caenorhabditis brenneri TaxID=135651 RepID=G0NBX0_CAEBE|nr:hypothetical protein CAEBREN_06431 [Caenorhabditis brenneri]
MLVSPFEEERARISDRLEKLNGELRNVSAMMEEFKIKYVRPAMQIRSPTSAQLFFLNALIQQATNFSIAFFELKKTYNEELEKIKEVDNRETIHNELAKFNM